MAILVRRLVLKSEKFPAGARKVLCVGLMVAALGRIWQVRKVHPLSLGNAQSSCGITRKHDVELQIDNLTIIFVDFGVKLLRVQCVSIITSILDAAIHVLQIQPSPTPQKVIDSHRRPVLHSKPLATYNNPHLHKRQHNGHTPTYTSTSTHGRHGRDEQRNGGDLQPLHRQVPRNSDAQSDRPMWRGIQLPRARYYRMDSQRFHESRQEPD
ncbi:hypothetical protein EDC01DRAFT_360839 [Geopyxis carbonaria]|nr:hypothetical protein EDC01DRAFT_360839 [Geopyxis carbonaria]